MKVKKKLLLSFLLSLCCLGLLSVNGKATEATEITLDANGDLRAAVTGAKSGDIINLNGNTVLVNDDNSNSEPWLIDKDITIKNGGISLRAGGIVLGGNVTFENIALGFPNPDRNVIAANGYTLTLNNTTREKNRDGSYAAQQIHLFCGTMYSSTGAVGTVQIPTPGPKGHIIITGEDVELGNIYAGNLSTMVEDTASSIPAEITVNVTGNSSIGMAYDGTIPNISGNFTVKSGIYSGGAVQTPGPGLTLDTNYTQCPPLPMESINGINLPVNAQITINLNNLTNSTISNVYGNTHGTGKSEVNFSGTEALVDSVAFIEPGTLMVASGKLVPSSHSNLLYSSVKVSAEGRLGFTNMTEVILDDFTGDGGTIVLNPEQTLTIEGLTTGQAYVSIGNGSYESNTSSHEPVVGRTYITTAAGSQQNAFQLWPYAQNSNIALVNEDGFNWIARETAAPAPVPAPLSFGDSEAYDIPQSRVEEAITPIDVSASVTGGTKPYYYSAQNLPAGIAINEATGIISGIPTAAREAGEAAIQVRDSAASPASVSITIAVGEVLEKEVTPPETSSYTVTTNVSPSEGGSVAGKKDNLQEGDTVSLTAQANPGWSFKGWESADRITITNAEDPALTFAMPAKNVTVTARFEKAATPQILDHLNILLEGPIAGALPPTTVTIVDAANQEIRDVVCESLRWDPQVTDFFQSDTAYTAQLTLRASESVTFSEKVAVEFGGAGASLVTDYEVSLAETNKVLNVTVKFRKTPPAGLWIEEIPAQTYTGKAIKPEVRVYYKNQLLTSKDYTLSYKNNVEAATEDAKNAKGKSIAPTVVIKGKGNFSGTVTEEFTILPINLNDYATDGELQKILSISPVYVKKTGKEIKGVPVVKLNGKSISLKAKQFTLEYPGQRDGAYLEAGSDEIRIVGTGKNFTGSTTVVQTISRKLILDVSIALDKSAYPYDALTGETYPRTITVKDGKTILEKGRDYEVSYVNYDRIGTAAVVITGRGEYSGVKAKTYKITGIKLTTSMVKQLTGFTYDGTKHSVVKGVNYQIADKGVELQEGKDYEISYTGERTNAGKFKVTFKGINQYAGSVTKTYTIAKVNASRLSVNLPNADSVEYAKNGSMPKPEVRFAGTLLQEGKDYTITYVNNKKTALSTDRKAPCFYLTGKGNFTGNTKSTPIKFTIINSSLEDQVMIKAEDILYKNKRNNHVPVLTLTDKESGKKLSKKADYQVNYTYEIWDKDLGGYKPFMDERVEASEERIRMRITVTGAGNYTGSISAEYEIYPKSITAIKVDRILAQEYKGEEIEPVPVVTIRVKEGKKSKYVPLSAENYEVEYENNINRGTATMYIYGKGEYGGVKKVTFKITSQKMFWWDAIKKAIFS